MRFHASRTERNALYVEDGTKARATDEPAGQRDSTTKLCMKYPHPQA